MVGNQRVSPIQLSWSSPDLVFVVREPFASKHSQAGLVGGILHEGESLKIESRMPAGGTIFSDGVESDFLLFNSGAIATIQKAPEHALIYAPAAPLPPVHKETLAKQILQIGGRATHGAILLT